jgi:hypothetical protein
MKKNKAECHFYYYYYNNKNNNAGIGKKKQLALHSKAIRDRVRQEAKLEEE